MKISQLVALGLAVVAGAANAALPTDATAAFTAMSGNVTDIMAAVWPISIALTGGYFLLKHFKKGANRA
jgi:hypothetical protein